MKQVLHITSGDIVGENLRKGGVSGEVFVWHDILYDGPRNPGWPDEDTLRARAVFIEEATGGGLERQLVLSGLKDQYRKLETARDHDGLVLWFDACLFDQSMLVHILACMQAKGIERAELVCVDAFPGIERFHGLGQIPPEQLVRLLPQSRPISADQFTFAERVDRAFALQDRAEFVELSNYRDAPLPWVPAAVARWLKEQPDETTGLGLLERLALEAVCNGCEHPTEIFKYVAAHDTPPQYWGDTMLWGAVNRLATRRPPLVGIEGPRPYLPQWNAAQDVKAFRVHPA